MAQGAVVLIADPDTEACGRYELALARAGFTVTSTTDGTSALRLATRIAPDDVLTEIDLPHLDGFTLARRLRRQRETEHVGIVALTTHDGEDLHKRAAECGIDRLLRKDRPIHEVVRAVRTTIRGSRALAQQSSDLRGQVDVHLSVNRNLRERAEDVLAESRVLAADIAQALGVGSAQPQPAEDLLLQEADGARDVLIADRTRGVQLFDALFTRYGDHPLLYYKRGEAYRASGHRKLAHLEFVAAAEKFPPGAWRDRARLAAMRTRSHHEKPK